jgi:hypothetical protein
MHGEPVGGMAPSLRSTGSDHQASHISSGFFDAESFGR